MGKEVEERKRHRLRHERRVLVHYHYIHIITRWDYCRIVYGLRRETLMVYTLEDVV